MSICPNVNISSRSICPVGRFVRMSICPNVDMSECRSVRILICPFGRFVQSVDFSECRFVRMSICPNVDTSGFVDVLGVGVTKSPCSDSFQLSLSCNGDIGKPPSSDSPGVAGIITSEFLLSTYFHFFTVYFISFSIYSGIFQFPLSFPILHIIFIHFFNFFFHFSPISFKFNSNSFQFILIHFHLFRYLPFFFHF